MNFVTYVERDAFPYGDWFCTVIATGPNTEPTPDGGPWATEYVVPHGDRARLREISENAERMVFQMVRARAPAVYARAVQLGWVPESLRGAS